MTYVPSEFSKKFSNEQIVIGYNDDPMVFEQHSFDPFNTIFIRDNSIIVMNKISHTKKVFEIDKHPRIYIDIVSRPKHSAILLVIRQGKEIVEESLGFLSKEVISFLNNLILKDYNDYTLAEQKNMSSSAEVVEKTFLDHYDPTYSNTITGVKRQDISFKIPLNDLHIYNNAYFWWVCAFSLFFAFFACLFVWGLQSAAMGALAIPCAVSSFFIVVRNIFCLGSSSVSLTVLERYKEKQSFVLNNALASIIMFAISCYLFFYVNNMFFILFLLMFIYNMIIYVKSLPLDYLLIDFPHRGIIRINEDEYNYLNRQISFSITRKKKESLIYAGECRYNYYFNILEFDRLTKELLIDNSKTTLFEPFFENLIF